MDAPKSAHRDDQPREAELWDRLLFKIAAVDVETLKNCPPRDWQNARSVAIIMILNWVYQGTLFTLIGHRLWAPPGQIRLGLLFASALLAAFILAIDRYQVILSGWNLSGIEELKRGGIDIGGGPLARIKANCFLFVRILLSIGNAQLSAIFLSLSIFAADLDFRARSTWTQANAPLISDATKPIDGEIRRATEAVDAQSARVEKLASQITALRQNAVDPSAANPEILQAQKELSRLVDGKAKADDALRDAETFAANEGGGIKGTAANSGHAGYGARYKAAMQQVANARSRVQELTRELAAARERLDVLRMQAPPTEDAIRQRAQAQLPDFDKNLEAENAKLLKLKGALAALSAGREEAIRKAVEAAPNHVRLDRGFLAQVRGLEQLASESTIIWSVIVLIDVVSFGFELAAVLVKVTSYVPTTYTALLARDCYMAAVQIAEGMSAELKSIGGHERPAAEPEQNAAAEEPDGAETVPDAFGSANEPPADPIKRPRGRPRKHPASNAAVKSSNGQGPSQPPSDQAA